MTSARHGRQVRLAEVGEDGQARLEGAEIVLGSQGDARVIEATYLRVAGVQVREAHASHGPKVRAKQRAEDKAVADTVKALGIADPAAVDVATGAMRALVAMRAVLGVGAAKDDAS